MTRAPHVAWTLAVLGLVLATAPCLRAAPSAPAVAPHGLRVEGVNYYDARAQFAKLGYRATYDSERQALTLKPRQPGPVGRELVLTGDKREATLDGMRIFLGEPALLHRGALHLAAIDYERFLLPILRPERQPARPLRTIVIDAGHGGVDTGTQNKKHSLDEKNFALDVALRLEALLAAKKFRVVQTRTDDRFIPLAQRAEIANAARADLFISVHFNAVANNPKVRGTETYVLTPQFQRSTSSLKASAEDKEKQVGNRHDVWSAVLGYHVHRQLLGELKSEDRGYKRARFAVLRLVDCPAVLVEAGYLSNDAEALLIASEAYRARIAKAVAEAVVAYDQARRGAEAGAVRLPELTR
ncbi:MAG: N-acetylmuramoyl-L-alanine amidase [Opitutaceae bacterium]|nr:N-acetylmuramoyl-L-alanine amidase [Opitutaceae bacterium]